MKTFILTFLFFVILSGQAFAQGAACDTNIWTEINGQATAIAEEDVSVAKDVIKQADSVLQYSCFDSLVGDIAGQQEFLFGEPVAPSSDKVTPTDLDEEAQSKIGNPLDNYLNQFNSRPLGGTGETVLNTGGSITPSGYTCNVMNRVWDEARCNNFSASGGASPSGC